MKVVLAALGMLLAACSTPPASGLPGSACWVQMYANAQYRPPMTTFTGPSFERTPPAAAGSLRVGPGARLLGYADANLHRPTLVLPPGTDVAQLDAIDFHRRVRAFDVQCEATAGQ